METSNPDLSKNRIRYEKYRLSKGTDYSKMVLLAKCRRETRLPTKASIEKYNITPEELEKLFENIKSNIK